MKRPLQLLALAAALAAPAALSAQSDKTLSLGVSGGLSLPMGDFGDAFNSGFNVTGHVYFKPAALSSVRLRGDVSLDRWSADVADVTSRSLGFMGNVVYDFPTEKSATVKPYLLGGFGVHNGESTVQSGGRDLSVSDSNLAFQAGGGLTFQLSGFSTFAEARWVNVFGDGDSQRFLPITFGVRF